MEKKVYLFIKYLMRVSVIKDIWDIKKIYEIIIIVTSLFNFNMFLSSFNSTNCLKNGIVFIFLAYFLFFFFFDTEKS